MTASTTAEIRMYRLNELGDCFLVTFRHGPGKSRLLIDCGSFRNNAASVKRMNEIVDAIEAELGGDRLDVVVGTHQHNDHVSGFVHCEDRFRDMGIDQVWLSWLDDPQDRMARDLGEAHNNLTLQLAAVRDRLASSPINVAGLRAFEVLTDVLGFSGWRAAGEPPQTPAKGMAILKDIGERPPMYLRPGRTLEMPGLPKGTVRAHVLGPPRSPELLRRTNPRAGESYDHALAAATAQAARFLDAVRHHAGELTREELQYPFSERNKLRRARGVSPALAGLKERYGRAADKWRQIDNDWLDQAGALALYLNSYTNNSSLALALELVDSGKVLLFAGDAQIGNWLSWEGVRWNEQSIQTDDLLARTVFYKVGHHASHNATLVAGLEKMTSSELVALIPVHKKDANITKKNGWRMPATNLFNRLAEKTNHRVLQMDGVNPKACNPRNSPAKEAWRKLGIKPTTTPTEIKVTIGG
jgi:beta-lactamase superfamily II metal-dependent hydrolase